MRRSDHTMHIIIAMILIVMLPHFARLPPWVLLWCMCFWSYAVLTRKYKWLDPPKILLRTLTVLGLAGVLLTYRQGVNQEACVSLLATMAGLKPLETNSDKDRMTIVFMTYFFVIGNLNYSTSLGVLVYMFLSVLITITVLIHINHPRGRLTWQLRQAAKIMLQALPLMVMIFFLFPRLPESLVERQGETAGITGFSDKLGMGDITHLARSTAIAFRVEFDGPVPQTDQLYWRGIVFHYFDGKTWKTEPRRINRIQPLEGENPVSYSVMLEPHGKRWLFALDLPATSSDNSRILREHILYSDKNVKQRTQYDVMSYLKPKTDYLDEQDLKYVHLAGKGNPRTSELARDWKERTDSTEQLVALALDYFKNNQFTYTLNPPPLTGDIIDDFLFRTRMGYCEHYASAFALLMHEANIPTRVVGGYLGGIVNPYGNYLVVRQYQAHVWTEVWHEGKGWVRVDPTSVVAPERVDQSRLPINSPAFLNLLGLSEYYMNLSLGWDALNNQWNSWFFSYSFYRQKRLLANFGIELNSWFDPVKLFLLIFCVTGIFILVFMFSPLKKRKTIQQDDIFRLYNRFCNKLARIGFPRNPGQGPVDYANHVSVSRGDLAAEVQNITTLYIKLRYDRGGDEEMLKSFKMKVKRFKPVREPVGR